MTFRRTEWRRPIEIGDRIIVNHISVGEVRQRYVGFVRTFAERRDSVVQLIVVEPDPTVDQEVPKHILAAGYGAYHPTKVEHA